MPKSPSGKRNLIDKANTRMVAYVGVAAFLLVFSAVATKTLASQIKYQNHVISAKKKARNQLQADIAATSTLKSSYDKFVSQTPNVIGGDPQGTAQKDGNNAKIVLDALPSGYDFPGLATSLDNLLSAQNNVHINSITGTDDEVAQGSNESSADPQPVPIPFSVSVSSDYGGVQNVIGVFEHSIRPMQIQTMNLSGNTGNITMTLTAQTYYQPAKSLNTRTEIVK